MDTQALTILGAKVRLAAIDQEALELKALLNGHRGKRGPGAPTNVRVVAKKTRTWSRAQREEAAKRTKAMWAAKKKEAKAKK